MNRTSLEAAFWLGPLMVLYVYVGFPLLISLLARYRSVHSSGGGHGAYARPVTVIIPAYNEERNIRARICNVLESDYPRKLLDVIVVSDASTDRTNEIAGTFESDGVRLIVQEMRRGKTAGLNRAIQIARGDIVVFTDANSAYPTTTIPILVSHLQESKVGLVSGHTRYTVNEVGEVAEATNAYTSLERTIKKAESRWGCCVGADGAIFAMRRSLYRPLQDDDINDLVLPLSVIDQGFDCVLADEAFCSEHAGHNLESEFRRQSRITNRSLRAIWRRAHLLDPFRFPVFSFFLLSHKVLRFLVPVSLCVSSLTLIGLARHSRLYFSLASVAAVLIMLLLATADRQPVRSGKWLRPIRLLYVFITMNVAMLHGWWKFLIGRADVTWQHDRALSR